MINKKQALGLAVAVTSAFAVSASADVVISQATPTDYAVNLTLEGSLDWLNLGPGTDVSEEKADAAYISAVAVDGIAATYAENAYLTSWTDGAVTASGTSVQGDWQAKRTSDTETTSALSFSVDNLDAGQYELTVYGSRYRAATSLTASIGTEDTATAVFGTSTSGGTTYGVFTINFDIENAGESLDVVFNMTASRNSDSNVAISAVTLASIPEPATLGLIAAFGGGILGVRRRFML